MASSDEQGLDKAFMYLAHAQEVIDARHIEIPKLRRRIDWYILPLMLACYTVQFLDKVALNYSAVMGLPEDLELEGNDFSNAATAFFAAYLGAELINFAMLHKLPPARWLGANVILWGIACGAAAGATDYTTLVVARVFLGIFEAAIGPSLILISGQWYRKEQQILRVCIWYCGLGCGQIVGGLVSYGFQNVQGSSLASWRIMFLTVGGLTIIVGALILFLLPDNPMSAYFLSNAEKTAIIDYVSVNRTGIANTNFRKKQLLELISDPQIWLLILITVLISISSGVVTTYSTTLLGLFGFSPQRAALLNTPSGAVTIVSTLSVGILIRYSILPRSAALIAVAIPALIGSCLLAYIPSPTPLAVHAHQDNRGALLAGIYLINCVTPTLAIIYAWVAANVAGSTKRVAAACLISGSFGVGNIVSPQTFQDSDLPTGYKPARVAVVATQAAAIGMTGVLFAWYWFSNRQIVGGNTEDDLKDSEMGSAEKKDRWLGLTDKEDARFRYVY